MGSVCRGGDRDGAQHRVDVTGPAGIQRMGARAVRGGDVAGRGAGRAVRRHPYGRPSADLPRRGMPGGRLVGGRHSTPEENVKLARQRLSAAVEKLKPIAQDLQAAFYAFEDAAKPPNGKVVDDQPLSIPRAAS